LRRARIEWPRRCDRIVGCDGDRERLRRSVERGAFTQSAHDRSEFDERDLVDHNSDGDDEMPRAAIQCDRRAGRIVRHARCEPDQDRRDRCDDTSVANACGFRGRDDRSVHHDRHDAGDEHHVRFAHAAAAAVFGSRSVPPRLAAGL
jgi:hypothetical protein